MKSFMKTVRKFDTRMTIFLNNSNSLNTSVHKIQMLMASSTMARPYKGSSNLREIRARENRTRYRSDWKSHVHTMQYAGQ
ncbi:hypothetical protein J6590_056726 [Homalodisca vitripennis]|nr:hypothetical protein J6590_056726 [Homalodisca vitripennis]